MDKFIRNFFNSVLNDGGSPVYSSQPGKIKSSPDMKESLKRIGSYFSSKSKPVEKVEAKLPMEIEKKVAETKSEAGRKEV